MASPYLNNPQMPPAGAPPSQNPGSYNPAVRTSPLSVVSLIMGIISVITALCMGWVLAVVAIILGAIALAQIGGSQGMLKGKGMAITGIVTSIVSLTLGIGLIVLALNSESGPKVIDHVDEAESKIMSKTDGKIAHGNSAEAEALAEQFSARLKMMRKLGIEGGDEDPGFSLSGGEFLTFCQLDEDSCAFLVRVPDLRNFEQDAKDFINESAWSVAQQLLKDSSLPDGADLAVATKGVILYDEINIGKHYKEIPEDADADFGIEDSSSFDSDLDPFFPPPTIIEEEEEDKPATSSY
ncbi:MAG: DUF4190 domain-containing protein [Verrucomicrobiota bacterium]